jgi:SAM-dependent methyltransferase
MVLSAMYGNHTENDSTETEHYDSLWRRGDPWQYETSAFEREKYRREISALKGRRYARALEIGCGAGAFTRLLSDLSDEVDALDISPSAIQQARQSVPLSTVRFHVANVMTWEPLGHLKWDLITIADTIACIGSTYSVLEVACLAATLIGATAPGGRLLLADTYGGVPELPFRAWITRTYHDLFVNIGYQQETEELFRGVKDGMEIPVLISVFVKVAEDADEIDHRLWA